MTHADLGQMQMYVNYYERELMNPGDNPPIGTEQELIAELRRERAAIEEAQMIGALEVGEPKRNKKKGKVR